MSSRLPFAFGLFLLFVSAAHAQERLTPTEAADLYKEAYASYQAGEYTKALQTMQRVAEAAPRVWGEKSAQYGTVLNLLGSIHKILGEHRQAEAAYLRSLKIREAVLGPDHDDVAQSLNNLAGVYAEQGEYAKAEPLHQRGLKILESRLGPDHPRVANCLGNLANLYRSMGQYVKSEPLCQRSLRILETTLGPDHVQVADTLDNLGVLYDDMYDYEKAVATYQRSLAIREKAQGPDHPRVGVILHNLGGAFLAQGQYAKAESFHQRSLKIMEARFGADHIEMARGLNNLGIVYLNLRDFAKAESVLERSYRIRRATLGELHPDISESSINLASVYAATNRIAAARDSVGQARKLIRRHALRELPFLPDAEQLAFLNKADWGIDPALSLALAYPDRAELSAHSASWLLNFKGLSHQSLAARSILTRAGTDGRNSAAVEELVTVRRRIAALAQQQLAREHKNEALSRQLADLAASERNLVQRLARLSPQLAAADTWTDVASVSKAVPADAVLIELAWFFSIERVSRKPTGGRYAAWVIRPGEDADKVRMFDLGPAAPIDAAVQAARKALGEAPKLIKEQGDVESDKTLRGPLEALAKLVLHPLLPHIGEKKQWIIGPDASLWLVPWAALPLADGSYAVEKHAIRYVISGRDLIASDMAGAKLPEPNMPAIFADPNFDLGLAEAAAETRRVLMRDTGTLALRARAESLGKVQWTRLPGTAAEAESIGPNLEKFAGKKPYVYKENFALEGVLKAFPRPRVAVLSTHGFFLEDEPMIDSRSSAQGATATANRPSLFENPLLRCGLVLAGANHKSTDANLEDGVLTGLEIVGLDLRGTELVVLSACETGLGDVRNGEGVAGLRQAFQLAGAQSVVATLWQIPDRDSALLMNDFFDQLAKGKTKTEALREAQLARIKARRDRFGAAHPFFWAAYTLTGK